MSTFAPYENRSTRCRCIDRSNGQGQLQCGAHLHEHIEFVYMLDGKTNCTVDSDSYTIQQGDLLVVFPNRVHSFTSTEKEYYLLFIVDTSLMPELASYFSGFIPKEPVLSGIGIDSDIAKLLFALLKYDGEIPKGEGESKYLWEISRRGILLALFGKIFSLPDMSKGNSSDNDGRAIRTVVNYCAKNFTHELSLATLEEELHLSRYYISHLFSSHMKVRFNDYINSLRIAEACRYLKMTDKSITEISALVGFSTPRTFNRAFNKQMGMSPKGYRSGEGGAKTSGSIPI